VDRSATLDAPFLLGTPRAAREGSLDRERTLDRFLAGIERRALRIAQLALRNRAEAEDAVQDAMIRLARHYASRPEEEWRPLFYRILGNRIIDIQRRERLRRAVTVIWRGSPDDERAADPLESAVDPRGRLVRGAYQRFQSLPPEQRNDLRERRERMSPEARRRAISRRQGPKPGSIDKRPCPPC